MKIFKEFIKSVHTYEPEKLEEQLKEAKEGTIFMLDDTTFVQVHKISRILPRK